MPSQGYLVMANLLADKDRQWRKRPNGASDVFDPGLSPLGTDDEAGGASAPVSADPDSPSPDPLPTAPDRGGHGLRLPYPFWWGLVGLLCLMLVLAAVFSLG